MTTPTPTPRTDAIALHGDLNEDAYMDQMTALARQLGRELTEAQGGQTMVTLESYCSMVRGPNPWSPHDYLAAPIDTVRDLLTEVEVLKAKLIVAKERADLLTFLQTEGYAWPDDYIRRHMAICKDKRSQQQQSQSEHHQPKP